MTWRRVAAYWACFVLLGAYYLLALREAPGPEAAHLQRAPFLDLSGARIESVEVRRGAAVIRCRRSGDRWHVVEPAGAAVPSDLVAALVANLTQLPDVEVVAEGGADVAQFGLQPPASEIILGIGGDGATRVRLGGRNPAGTAVYAQRDDSARVFLIGLNVRYYEDLLFQAARPG